MSDPGMSEAGRGCTALVCRIRHTTPIGLIEVVGTLRLETVPRLREAVLKVLGNCPQTMMLDLAETAGIEDDLSLVTLATLGELVADRTTEELLVATPSLRARVALQRYSPLFVRVFATRAEAWLAAGQGIAPHRVRRDLPASPQAPMLARRTVSDVCTQWQLSAELGEQAQLVVAELVTNAVQHAGNGIGLTVTVRRNVLRLEVSDDSDVLPYPLESALGMLRGHGLRLVAGLARHWGCEATNRGKIVWADLVIGVERG